MEDSANTVDDNPSPGQLPNGGPVARLPAELLIHIFSFVSDTSISISPVKPNYLQLGLVVVMHVCRNWRELALKTPNLWREIDANSEGGESPLKEQLLLFQPSISWTVSSQLPSPQVALLSQYTSHLKKLRIIDSDPRDHTGEFIEEVLTQPAPLLEELELSLHASRRDGDLKALPSDLFAGQIPHLRRLIIRMDRVPWLLPCISSLTELIINVNTRMNPSDFDSAFNPKYPSTESMLYEALCHMQSLRKLILVGGLPVPPLSSTPRMRGVAEMPHLELLHLSGEATVCDPVEGYIKRPATCELRLRCLLKPTARIQDVDFLLPILNGFSPLAEYVIHVHSFTTNSVCLSLVESSADQYREIAVHNAEWYRPGSTPHACIEVKCRAGDDGPPGWRPFPAFKKLLGAIPLAQVHTLAFNEVNTGTHRSWMSISAMFPSVQHLHVTRRQLGVLIAAWSSEMCDRWAYLAEFAAEDVRVNPGLVSLSIVDVDLNHTLDFGMPLHKALLKALVERKNAGLPLNRLSLIGCQTDAAWVKEIEEVVPVSVVAKADTAAEDALVENRILSRAHASDSTEYSEHS
ncbi:hypothetical protein DENSPDRAFT_885171 [Dentipellis sp. KUC8613]|nr:hypothetical protein DENSPDRAFT_885171 [Dentipellis sp. KUC8613]